MAKVMISIPDDLLSRIDAQAEAERESRSGFIQRLAERELEDRNAERRRDVARLLDAATGRYGGDGAELVRRERRAR